MPDSTSKLICPFGRSRFRSTSLSTRSRKVRSSTGGGADRRVTIRWGRAAAVVPVRLLGGRGELPGGIAGTAAELFRRPADPVRDVAPYLLEINLLQVRHHASPPR